MPDADWLRPSWQADGVSALMTTRRGGCSRAPFDSMNLGASVGDDTAAVARNVALLAEALGAAPVFLNQVHGAGVVRLAAADATAGAPLHEADASVTTVPGVVLAVRIADCLPVLFAAPGGRAVGAAHAGWRGLAAGVLDATVAEMCAAASCRPAELHAWLGACIGPKAFEVGADVLAAFDVDAATDAGAATPGFVPGARPGKWFADLPWLATQRLRRAGVERIGGGTWCTATDASRFFSFRRDRVTGRMAACIRIGGGSGEG